MIKKVFLVYSLMMVIFVNLVLGQSVRPDHPRLFLTSDNLPEIRSKLQTYYSSEYQEFLDIANNEFNGSSWLHVINFAFIYQVGDLPGFSSSHSAADFGQRAKSLLLSLPVDNLIRGEHPDLTKSKFGLPIGYDWLFSLLSQSEKQELVNKMSNMVNNTTKLAPIFGHMVGIGSSLYVIHGLAFYGDGFNDSLAQQVYDLFYDEIMGAHGKVAGKNMSAGNEGGSNSGFEYNLYYLKYLAFPVDAWRTATNQDYFPVSPFWRYFPQYLLYNIIPWAFEDASSPGGREWILYHDHHDKAYRRASRYTFDLTMLQSWYRNVDLDMVGLGQWLLDNRVGTNMYQSEKWEKYVFYYFLWGYPGTSPLSPSQLNLPKSIIFTGIGEAVMRTGFTDINDCMIVFKAMPYAYSGGYWSAKDQGSFSIYKRGFLTFGSGSGAHHDYGNSTISRNTLIFDVPGQNYSSSHSDEGGQREVREVEVLDSLVPGSRWDIGGIQKHRFEEDEFDYIFADLTRAYNSTLVRDNYPDENPTKISLFTRELVYMRPSSNLESDYIFIFDRTKTVDAQIVKRWLLHMSYEPDINANGQPTNISGEWVYPNADLVKITNTFNGANGRLFVKSLLPANRDIYKIGGPGHEFMNILNHNDCDGAKLPSGGCPNINDESAYFVGRWRIEVRPATQQQYDIFFHVFQTATASENSMEPVTLIDNQNNYYGAYIDHNVVLFSKTSDFQNQAQYTISVSGNTRHLICNLNPGVYRVYVDGSQVTSVQVDEDGTAFFLHSGGSNFRVTKSNDTIPPSKPTGLRIEK